MDGEHSGEISRWGTPGSPAILRGMGMDDYHSRVHATCYILSVPLSHMSVRDMEDVLQMQIEQRRPHPLLNQTCFVLEILVLDSSSLNCYSIKIYVTFNKKRKKATRKERKTLSRSL